MPSDEEIKYRLIESVYDTCEGEEILCPVVRRSLVEEVTEDLGAETNEVEYILKRAIDDGLLSRDKNSIHIQPAGVEYLQDNGKEVLLDEAVQYQILEMLYEAEREDPHHPNVNKETFETNIEADEETINQNLWYLRENWYVELQQYIGSLYHSASITNSGRQAYERMSS